MASRKYWGEFEEEEQPDESLLQGVNFDPIIDLASKDIPELPTNVQSTSVVFPQPNLITHTIQLHTLSRQLLAILEQTKKSVSKGARLDALSIPQFPPEIPPNSSHQNRFSDFSLGKGPATILPFTEESHQRALKQCAAIAIGHVGISTATNTALDATADALDFYLTKMCKMIRIAVDAETGGTHSGFPDIISKVFTELKVGNLQDFYKIRVVQYHEKIKNECINLRQRCEALAIHKVPPGYKVDKVPQQSPSTSLDRPLTPSLEPTFQILEDITQEQPQTKDTLDLITDDLKLDSFDFAKPSTSKMVTNPKKKRK